MATQKERILLVESDPDNSELIARQALQPQGYQIRVATNAGAAIKQAVEFSPDVIIANLSLMGLSGKDLLVALSSQNIEIPIIMIAPPGMESDVIQAFRLGASDYVNSPVREAEVISAVERALKQVRARREREQLARQVKRTNEELQKRVRELTTIFGIGKAVTGITDQQALFEKIIEGAVLVTDADYGWLLRRDEKSPNFILRAYHKLPKTFASKLHQPWDDGISSLVAMSGESLTIHGDALKRFKVSRIGQAALVVPVKVQKEVVALLVVIRKKSQPFTKSDQAMMEGVADYASISLVNVRLFQALDERAQSLQKSIEESKANEDLKEEILESVSHEMRSPLVAAKGEVDKFSAGDLGKLNKNQTKAITAIQEKLARVVEIVDAMSALQEAASAKKPQEINLNDLTSQAVGRFQKEARQHGIKFETKLPAKPVMAFADPDQIAQVFDSLFSNAIKFSPQGGKVIVQVASNDQSQAHVTVQDTGVGIDNKNLPRIFDHFYQVDASAANQNGGLGIGLSIAKEIITAHGGKVWAESKPGEGSAFHFTIRPPE